VTFLYLDNNFPDEIPGLGTRHTTPFARCRECRQPTYQSYGATPLCPPCSRRLAKQTETKNTPPSAA
jgi:hypothetical protein